MGRRWAVRVDRGAGPGVPASRCVDGDSLRVADDFLSGVVTAVGAVEGSDGDGSGTRSGRAVVEIFGTPALGPVDAR